MPSIPLNDPRRKDRKKRFGKARSFLPSGRPNFAASVPFFGSPGGDVKWYGQKWWKNTRERVLREDPLCGVCLLLGRAVEATDVDHIEPHEGNYELFHDRTNLWGLCKSCHATKSSYEAKGMRFEERITWGKFLARKKKEKE